MGKCIKTKECSALFASKDFMTYNTAAASETTHKYWRNAAMVVRMTLQGSRGALISDSNQMKSAVAVRGRIG